MQSTKTRSCLRGLIKEVEERGVLLKKYLLKCKLLLFPSLFGIALFYVIPYIRVIYYSFIENQFSRRFV